jgi:probable addiction module antidote protein
MTVHGAPASRLRNTPRDASHDDYMALSMKDPVEAAAYIEVVMELDDPAVLLIALRHVAKAHGMAEVARRADMGDKTLFKALSAEGSPTLTTVHKVLAAVGLHLSVAPAHA